MQQQSKSSAADRSSCPSSRKKCPLQLETTVERVQTCKRSTCSLIVALFHFFFNMSKCLSKCSCRCSWRELIELSHSTVHCYITARSSSSSRTCIRLISSIGINSGESVSNSFGLISLSGPLPRHIHHSHCLQALSTTTHTHILCRCAIKWVLFN